MQKPRVTWLLAYGRIRSRRRIFYQLAAAQGEAMAQCSLGYKMQIEDGGMKKGDAMTAELYRNSANQGYPLAQHALGRCYAHGQGVPKDQTMAQGPRRVLCQRSRRCPA